MREVNFEHLGKPTFGPNLLFFWPFQEPEREPYVKNLFIDYFFGHFVPNFFIFRRRNNSTIYSDICIGWDCSREVKEIIMNITVCVYIMKYIMKDQANYHRIAMF